MNLNTLFTKLTNFKIKFTENPSPTEVSNMPLMFLVDEGDYYRICKLDNISLSDPALAEDAVHIKLKEI